MHEQSLAHAIALAVYTWKAVLHILVYASFASASSTLSNDSQQTPYQISWPVELRPVNVPTEQERPRSKEGSTFQPQTLREPAGLPSDIYSPMRDEQMKPMPLMTRTPLGHAVVMELEGDMAQKYYEYRAQHVGQMDGMI